MNQLAIESLGIHIKVADVNRSRVFYESLGFVPSFAWNKHKAFEAPVPKEIEELDGVIFKIGASAELEIGASHPDVDPQVFKEKISSSKVSAMVKVASLVPLFENSKIQITYPVKVCSWGAVEAVIKDPDGFVVVFIAKNTEAELLAISKFASIE